MHPGPQAVLLDFYGTLARATHWISYEQVLAEHGHSLSPDAYERWHNDGIDGSEHDEHSQSRDHYVAWQRARALAMLAETDVHPGEYERILEQIRAGAASRVIEAYDEVPDVLADLRARGLQLVICSNWDWDLREAVDEAGLAGAVDVVVSSAWVGARKPHPRIYAHTLEAAGIEAAGTLFVGDTWGPDVAGPLAAGLTPLDLRRADHWPDGTCPHDDLATAEVPVIADLRGLVDHLGSTAVA
jgi:putative hydrolase of the HAD superfamily